MSDKGHESADRGRLAGAELMELRRGSDQSQPAEVSQSALQTALASSKVLRTNPHRLGKGPTSILANWKVRTKQIQIKVIPKAS